MLVAEIEGSEEQRAESVRGLAKGGALEIGWCDKIVRMRRE